MYNRCRRVVDYMCKGKKVGVEIRERHSQQHDFVVGNDDSRNIYYCVTTRRGQ